MVISVFFWGLTVLSTCHPFNSPFPLHSYSLISCLFLLPFSSPPALSHTYLPTSCSSLCSSFLFPTLLFHVFFLLVSSLLPLSSLSPHPYLTLFSLFPLSYENAILTFFTCFLPLFLLILLSRLIIFLRFLYFLLFLSPQASFVLHISSLLCLSFHPILPISPYLPHLPRPSQSFPLFVPETREDQVWSPINH